MRATFLFLSQSESVTFLLLYFSLYRKFFISCFRSCVSWQYYTFMTVLHIYDSITHLWQYSLQRDKQYGMCLSCRGNGGQFISHWIKVCAPSIFCCLGIQSWRGVAVTLLVDWSIFLPFCACSFSECGISFHSGPYLKALCSVNVEVVACGSLLHSLIRSSHLFFNLHYLLVLFVFSTETTRSTLLVPKFLRISCTPSWRMGKMSHSPTLR